MTMSQIAKRRIAVAYLATLFLLSVGLVGCGHLKLIADYDEQVDKQATALQKEIEVFMVGLERKLSNPDPQDDRYEAHTDFYDNVRVELSALKVRAAALPKNELTTSAVGRIEENIQLLEQAHMKGLKKEEIEPIRGAINLQFTSILKLELAKSRSKAIAE